jgi:hypothetical protein
VTQRAKLEAVVRVSLQRDTLKQICDAVGVDGIAKDKATLVERVLAAGGGKSATRVSERDVIFTNPPAPLLFEDLSERLEKASKPKGKAKRKTVQRRRAGVPESEAAIAGTLKAALQQFALSAAGGYGDGAPVAFTMHLLECFGWNAGRPEGAEIPGRFTIAESGQRVEREVALSWPERRTLMEVVAHDAVLDFAWKDLLRACLQLDVIPQYVVLTNQRDLHLYDLARDREAPRLAIRIDDLQKYSEAFPFFTKEGAFVRIYALKNAENPDAKLVFPFRGATGAT